jgi:hypothetical protein
VATHKRELPIVGWREWIALPDLGVNWVKAKVDTGARSSSLHAYELETFSRADAEWVRFAIHPWQRSVRNASRVEAQLFEWRNVRSSSGASERRPVIRTSVALGGQHHAIDLTLTRRDDMGFRMLLGREAVRRRFLVNPGKSFLTGKPPVDVVRANRGASS